MNKKSELSISEEVMYSTVRIQSCNSAGQLSTGTGFFYTVDGKDAARNDVIVTNKHVVEGGVTGTFVFNVSDKEGNHIVGKQEVVTLDNFEDLWIKHPDDQVDLCMLPLGPILTDLASRDVLLYWTSLTRDHIPTDEQIADLNAIEDIVMVGYPNGLWDRVNNFPIMRKGITATHPVNDYNGKSELLIDAACFPGSSGSPVFILNEGSFLDKKRGLMIGSRVYFLGILYAGHQFTTTGEIRVVDVPTKQQAISVSSIPNNLGIIIKAKNLITLERVWESSGYPVYQI